jgi:hypothetical protein
MIEIQLKYILNTNFPSSRHFYISRSYLQISTKHNNPNLFSIYIIILHLNLKKSFGDFLLF